MSSVELSRELIHKAETRGGTDYTDWLNYSWPESEHYSNKGGHRERSLYYSSQHRKHFQSISTNSITESYI
jgi:hypothetical protein